MRGCDRHRCDRCAEVWDGVGAAFPTLRREQLGCGHRVTATSGGLLIVTAWPGSASCTLTVREVFTSGPVQEVKARGRATVEALARSLGGRVTWDP